MANTSVTVTFVSSTGDADGGDDRQSIDVELDSDYNNDKTQFFYGEKAYFRIYTFPETMTLTLTQSDGTITEEGSGTASQTDQVTFANVNTASVSFPIDSITDHTWLGTSLGAISGSGTTITAAQVGVAVLDVTYNSNFRRYAISVPTKDGYDEYAVVVYIAGS